LRTASRTSGRGGGAATGSEAGVEIFCAAAGMADLDR
jgi:hypothetical protein